MEIANNTSINTLLVLVRNGLGIESSLDPHSRVSWTEVMDISIQQGVSAIAVDGVGTLCVRAEEQGLKIKCLEELEFPEYHARKLQWYTEPFKYDSKYEKRKAALRKLTGIWAPMGIKTLVLKGASIAQYYPNPGHRYSCDLDVFIGEDWEKGCKALERNGIKVDYNIYVHSKFHIGEIDVECHRFMRPIRGKGSLMKNFELYLRELLKESFKDDSSPIVNPPLMFNALFCVEHARDHFLHERLTLRRICDWVIIRKQPLDWNEFNMVCNRSGLTNFYKFFDRLADWVEGLIDYQDLPDFEKKALDEMFCEEYDDSHNHESLFKRRVRTFVAMFRSGWKYRAINDASMPVTLTKLVWTHFFAKEVKL